MRSLFKKPTPKKLVISLFFCITVLITLSIPALNLNHGFPTGEWDYGARIAEINQIRAGAIFPNIHEDNLSDHHISRFLPIYHGIIFSHLFTIAIVKATGIPTPNAMLLILEICLLFSFLFFVSIGYAHEKSFKGALIAGLGWVGLIFPAYLIAVYHGFYPQILGFTLGTVFLWRFIKSGRGLGVLETLLVLTTYPDFLIFMLPSEVLLEYRIYKKLNSIHLLKLLFSLGLFTMFLKRIPLFGFILFEIYGSLLGFVLLLYIGYQVFSTKKSFSPTFSVIIIFSSLVIFIDGYTILKTGFPTAYYGSKFMMWNLFIYSISVLLSQFKMHIKALLLVALTFINFWDSGFILSNSLANLIHFKSGFNGHMEKDLLNFRDHLGCTHILALSSFQGGNGSLIAANSYTPGKNSDISFITPLISEGVIEINELRTKIDMDISGTRSKFLQALNDFDNHEKVIPCITWKVTEGTIDSNNYPNLGLYKGRELIVIYNKFFLNQDHF